MAADLLIQTLLAGFVEEAQEIIQKLTRDLLDLEHAADATVATRLYDSAARGLHTLKGTAATVGLDALSDLAHRMEDVIAPHRANASSLPSATADALLKSLDLFLAGVRSEASGHPASTGEALAQLDALGGERAASTPAVVPAASAAPAPVAETPAELESSEPESSWRVSVREVIGLMREIERLRELRLRLEQRRQDAEELANTLSSIPGATEARSRLMFLHRQLGIDVNEAGSIVDAAEDELKAIGSVSVRTLQEPLRRAVRDLSRQLHKEARLSVVGTDAALDRRILEALRGPLLHLVRNAVDHGIEMPEVRAKRGKHSEGVVTVRIELQGNVLFATVEDDGAGVNVERVTDLALSRGLVPAEKLSRMTPAQVQQLIFLPGFSTRTEVTTSSGRGVGLDVVRSHVEALNGQVEVQSTLGQGSRFILTLPIEFGSSTLLTVRTGEYRFGVSIASVESLLLARPSDLRTNKSRVQVAHREELLQVQFLGALLGLSQSDAPVEGQPLLIIQAQGNRVALAVDEVLGDRDLTIRPLPAELRALPAYQGAATLADGELLLVLRADWLVDRGLKGAVVRESQRRALVVDDSLTARALHRTMLESGGFTVHTASSAAQALEQLVQSEYDVVVCDIDMSGMDGIAFTSALRSRPETRRPPVILVSAHDSEADRRRGLAAGAAGFLSKKECASGRLLSEVSAVLSRQRAVS